MFLAIGSIVAGIVGASPGVIVGRGLKQQLLTTMTAEQAAEWIAA